MLVERWSLVRQVVLCAAFRYAANQAPVYQTLSMARRPYFSQHRFGYLSFSCDTFDIDDQEILIANDSPCVVWKTTKPSLDGMINALAGRLLIMLNAFFFFF